MFLCTSHGTPAVSFSFFPPPPLSSPNLIFLLDTTESPDSPCCYAPPNILRTSTEFCSNRRQHTPRSTTLADAPRPSGNDKTSTSFDIEDEATKQNDDAIATRLLEITTIVATLLCVMANYHQSRRLAH